MSLLRSGNLPPPLRPRPPLEPMPPAQFQRLLETALLHHQKGRLPDAEKIYRQVRAAQPNHFDALHLSGALAYQQQRYKDAFEFLTQARRIDPRSSLCAMRLGLTCVSLGQFQPGEAHLRFSLKVEPKNIDAWLGLAAVLRQLGKTDEAITAYEKVVSLDPKSFEALGLIGALLSETKGRAAGVPYYQRALEINPRYAAGWCNLAIAHLLDHRFSDALTAFDRALAIQPDLVTALTGRAVAFQQSYQLGNAIASFDQAIAADPSQLEARSGKLLTLNYLSCDNAALFVEHAAFGRAAEGPGAPPASAQSSAFKNRLRIGFLSPDLRAHSIAYFLEPLLRHLDPEKFEIFLYHDHAVVDATSQRLRALAKNWKNFVGQLNPSVERILKADSLDVLIDLAGHTGFNRLPALAHRVAPVQVNYLGYPNTTGLSAMDFRLVDEFTDPRNQEDEFYTEQRVRFSSCAWAYQPPLVSPATIRSPSSRIIFGSFNNPAKLSPSTLKLWARILAEIPDALLRLKGHGLTETNTRLVVENQLREAGFDLNRVEMLGRTSHLESHLELYQDIDIALDPFPYNGTTTTCEALWMGVPVVTLRGNRHAARVGVSLLTTVGHPEWIAENEDAYVEIARQLACLPSRQNELREKLRHEMSQSVLLDHAGQAQRFGNALVECWNGCSAPADKCRQR